MTSRERIRKILNFKTPDRIGIHDTFLDETIKGWTRSGLPADRRAQDYFGFDFEIFDIDEVLPDRFPQDKGEEKFTVLSFSEPFQRLCSIHKREDVLRRLASAPERLKADLEYQTEEIINSFSTILKRGFKFDGAWAWGDLAYNKGLFFHPSSYKKMLLPLHKKIFRFLDSQGLHILFHSDGKIDDLIPSLLDTGVRAFHPLEENSGMDIYRLFKDFKDEMVFMGCMDIHRLIRERGAADAIKERIAFFKDNCSYIYHADYPITPDVSFKDYSLAVEALKEAGAYR